jgi:hypothetical protein
MYVSFLFKVAYTHYMNEYEFHVDTTIHELICSMTKRAHTDFGIDEVEYPYIKIVEMGQQNNVNGFDPELAPALQPSNETLRELYEGRYNKTSFYIRYSSTPMAVFEKQ